ncbi:MAG: hypothetical protein K2I78_03775, partial [Clostridia bacterium]|nr:hypothetical protein [Clostridia bacterium]
MGEADTLPEDLVKAIEEARASEFIKRYVPQKTMEEFLKYKTDEYSEYSLSKDKDEFAKGKYFPKI